MRIVEDNSWFGKEGLPALLGPGFLTTRPTQNGEYLDVAKFWVRI